MEMNINNGNTTNTSYHAPFFFYYCKYFCLLTWSRVFSYPIESFIQPGGIISISKYLPDNFEMLSPAPTTFMDHRNHTFIAVHIWFGSLSWLLFAVPFFAHPYSFNQWGVNVDVLIDVQWFKCNCVGVLINVDVDVLINIQWWDVQGCKCNYVGVLFNVDVDVLINVQWWVWKYWYVLINMQRWEWEYWYFGIIINISINV